MSSKLRKKGLNRVKRTYRAHDSLNIEVAFSFRLKSFLVYFQFNQTVTFSSNVFQVKRILFYFYKDSCLSLSCCVQIFQSLLCNTFANDIWLIVRDIYWIFFAPNVTIIICFRKILEREDELFIVGNILKSLEVSEEKVKIIFIFIVLRYVSRLLNVLKVKLN